MIKIDLSRAIAERMDITNKEADRFLSVWTDLVGECLAKGEPVQLTGFGQFSVRFVEAHQGRNPKTGDILQIPACYYPVFKAGKGLRERVANCQKPIADTVVQNKAEMDEPKATSSTKPTPTTKKRKAKEKTQDSE